MRVDWPAVFAGSGGRRVELPTYAFQGRRFWSQGVRQGPGDATALGVEGTGHPLLGAVVERPDSGGLVLTGRLSLAAQPWLADHSVGGVVLFPGTGFVELAIRAADEVGCAIIDELVLATPLVVQPGAGVQVQVVVGAAGDAGGRAVSVYSRRDRVRCGVVAARRGHARNSRRGGLGGFVGVAAGRCGKRGHFGWLCAARGARLRVWPGVSGLAAIWRRGPELFAEAAIPAETGVQRRDGNSSSAIGCGLTRHWACCRHH